MNSKLAGVVASLIEVIDVPWTYNRRDVGWLWDTHRARPGLTLHALIRIPGTLQLAHVDDLADVVRVVVAEIANGIRPFSELLVVSRFHEFLKAGHDLVELIDDVGPLLVVELVEGFLVVAGEVLIFHASKVIQIRRFQNNKW
jgi:hypothetical protein